MGARNALDLSGQRFAHWAVIRRAKTLAGYKESCWECRCDCGAIRVVGAGSLRKGASRSCGCFGAEERRAKRTVHGHSSGSGSPEYRVWCAMRNRCNNPRDAAFKDYGGRGICVCDRWSDFTLFLADMGKRPGLEYSIDRYPDNNGNYEPGNCRWATGSQQANNRRGNRTIVARGKEQTVAQWAAELGYAPRLINCRIWRGDTDPERLLEPPRMTRR